MKSGRLSYSKHQENRELVDSTNILQTRPFKKVEKGRIYGRATTVGLYLTVGESDSTNTDESLEV